jgi:hypothetical protein
VTLPLASDVGVLGGEAVIVTLAAPDFAGLATETALIETLGSAGIVSGAE